MDRNNDYIPPFDDNNKTNSPDESNSGFSETSTEEPITVDENSDNSTSKAFTEETSEGNASETFTEASSENDASETFTEAVAEDDTSKNITETSSEDNASEAFSGTTSENDTSDVEWESVPEFPNYERASFHDNSRQTAKNPFEQEKEFNTTRQFDKYSYDPSTLRSFDKQSESKSNKAPKKKSSKPGFITKKAFAICLLCAMLATSGLTIGGLKFSGLLDNSSGGNKASATNYTLTKSNGTTKSVKEIVAKNENAVVEIQTEKVSNDSWIKNYVTKGAGSGVIIDSNGYIMTCNHVIEGASSITVKLKDGTTKKATVVGADSQTDIAVLKIDGSGYSAVKYGDSSSISVGDQAVAIGNPLGELGGSVSAGIISARDRQLEVDGKAMTLLQTDTSINPGNSGGGLFDGQGNLIGIVVAKSSGSNVEGLGFTIPINTASKVAKELIQNGKVTGRAIIGVKIVDLTSAENAQKYGVRSTGIYIEEVTSSQAKKAGLQSGDMLYYVGNTKITSASTLKAELNKYKPGDKIKITVIRNDKTVDLNLVLSEG